VLPAALKRAREEILSLKNKKASGERRSRCLEETVWGRPREAGAELEEDEDRDEAGAEEERAA